MKNCKLTKSILMMVAIAVPAGFVLVALLPITSSADSALPFMKDLAGDTELPRPWGISLEYGFGNREHTLFNFNFRF